MTDRDSEPTLSQVMDEILRDFASSLRVMLPARIEKYDAATQLADVKPVILNTFETDEGIERREFPVISEVPVMFPRAGDFFLSLPLKPGHFVMLVFCDRSIDQWMRGDGGVKDPVWTHTHQLTDAVALAGWYPQQDALTEAHADNLVIGKQGGAQMHLKDDQVSLYEENAAAFVARADRTDADIDAVKNKLNAFISIFSAWTPVPNDGGSALKLAGTAWATSQASTSGSAADKVKAT